MEKAKIKPGLAALIVLASMFAGWQTLLLVCALLLLFCDLNDNVKNIMVKVVTFTAGLALFSMAWNLIVDLINVCTSSLTGVFDIINSYLEVGSKIDISKLQSYLINPATKLTNIVDNVVSLLITFAKFGFIIAILTGKQSKKTPITDKVNKFVSNFVNYVNNTDNGVNVEANNNMNNMNNYNNMNPMQ